MHAACISGSVEVVNLLINNLRAPGATEAPNAATTRVGIAGTLNDSFMIDMCVCVCVSVCVCGRACVRVYVHACVHNKIIRGNCM